MSVSVDALGQSASHTVRGDDSPDTVVDPRAIRDAGAGNGVAPLPTPANPLAADLAAPRPRDLCTDCGISRTDEPKRCGRACQFIRPDYPALERRVHGRVQDDARGDERYFGPYRRMLRAALDTPAAGA